MTACPSCDGELEVGIEYWNNHWFSCDKCKISVNLLKRDEYREKKGWKVWKWTGYEVLWSVDGLNSKEEALTEWIRRMKLESFI